MAIKNKTRKLKMKTKKRKSQTKRKTKKNKGLNIRKSRTVNPPKTIKPTVPPVPKAPTVSTVPSAPPLPKVLQPVNTNANMPTRVQLSQEALRASREQSQKILDAAAKHAAKGIRKGSKTLAKISQDPEVQRKFAETIVKVGDAVAVVAENGGDIFAALVEKIGPAARTITFASSDLIQDSVGNVILGAVGTVPVVGDIAEAVGEEFIDANDSFWRSFMALFKIFPDVMNIVQQGMNNTGEAIKVSDDLLRSMNELALAVNNVSGNLESEKAAPKNINAIKKGGRKNRKTKHKN